MTTKNNQANRGMNRSLLINSSVAEAALTIAGDSPAADSALTPGVGTVILLDRCERLKLFRRHNQAEILALQSLGKNSAQKNARKALALRAF